MPVAPKAAMYSLDGSRGQWIIVENIPNLFRADFQDKSFLPV
jgi:hypothetical protein